VKRHSVKFCSILTLGLLASTIGSPSAEAGLGKLWPFASKKHIKKQLDPVTGRVTELEEVNRQHTARIKDIDERTQAGIRAAMLKTEEADAKAIAAGQKAALAHTSASKAHDSVADVESRLNARLENVENYQLVKSVQVNFRLNQTEVDEAARHTLDELAAELRDSKGYLLEIEGFADPTGSRQTNIELSKERAKSVVRYFSEKYEVPLFRMRTLGMGSSNLVQDENGRLSSKKSRRVEVRVLRTDASEMAFK
jgi:outer membrane protein OmpA-like peptidoglycan-associated protein